MTSLKRLLGRGPDRIGEVSIWIKATSTGHEESESTGSLGLVSGYVFEQEL